MKVDRAGFTLIELIVVVIIIGILAAIAAPMMSGNTMKAKKAEAMAVLGTLVTAQQCFLTETGGTATCPTGTVGDSEEHLSGYIKPSDLDGKYFNHMTYSVSSTLYGTRTPVAADTRISPDPGLQAQTHNYWLILDENGDFVEADSRPW